MAEDLSASGPAPNVTDSSPDDAGNDRARVRILDIARSESENAAEAVQRERDNAIRAEVIAKTVPERYLQIVGELRQAVQLFNQSLRPPDGLAIPIITWMETPNVVLGDATGGDGMRVRLARRGATFDLLLRFASRAGRTDVPLIEGHGDYGKQQVRTRTMMRIEGWVEKGQPIFWFSLDFKRLSIPLSEVAERIVASVAANDYTLLSRDLNVDFGESDHYSNEQ